MEYRTKGEVTLERIYEEFRNSPEYDCVGAMQIWEELVSRVEKWSEPIHIKTIMDLISKNREAIRWFEDYGLITSIKPKLYYYGEELSEEEYRYSNKVVVKLVRRHGNILLAVVDKRGEVDGPGYICKISLEDGITLCSDLGEFGFPRDEGKCIRIISEHPQS